MHHRHAWPNHILNKLIHSHLLWYSPKQESFVFWLLTLVTGTSPLESPPTADAIKTTEKGEVQVQAPSSFPFLGITAWSTQREFRVQGLQAW